MFAAGDLERLEECGRRLLTPETIADLFGLDRKKVKAHFEQDNEATAAYRKGVAQTLFDVQGADVNFAKMGAPNAIKNVIGYIDRLD